MNLTNIKVFILCHYSLAKFLLKRMFPNVYKDESPTIVAQIPILILNVLILMISIPILMLFYCYKRIVISILKYRHCSKFVGLITGCDLLTSLNDKNGIVVSTVLFLDSKKKGEDLFDEISKRIWDEYTDKDMDKRLVSIRESFMGYLYFKEVDNLNSIDVLHCIRSDKNVITEEELTEFLNYHCNVKPLPLNGTFNWDFSIVATPLRLNNGETRYLMILRMQHFIIDGLTMYNLIKRITIAKENEVAYADNMSSKLKTQQMKKTISTNLKTISLINFPVPITDESQMKYKPKTKGHLSILVEPTQNYVLKLKEIKNKIPGASFNALILTAYSASLANYFQNFTPKNVKIPTKLKIAAPIQINMDRFSKYFGSKRITKIGNDFTFMTMDIPIVPEDQRNIPIENYLTERLEMIINSFEDYNKTIDHMFNYTLTKTFLEVFTTKIASAVLNYASYNIIMSILPGGPKLVCQGDDIKSVLFMMPLHANKIDINFFTLSYDDKFQFVQTIDENKFECVEKMDDVLKGILKYIDILYDRFVKTN